MSELKPHLLVFSDDWGRHPSSCQYLIAELLPTTRVTWVNTIGMRPPRFDRATVDRVFGKLKTLAAHRSSSSIPANPQPQVVQPLMWPWFTRAYDRWLNRRLLAQRINQHLARVPGSTIAVTTIPIVADLVGSLSVDRWVYYCVDDFSVWPGLDQRTMLTMEQALVGKIDRAVAASEVLAQRLHSMNRPSKLLTHGVDVEHWSAPSFTYHWPESIRQPVALFWGVIDQRLDVDFIAELAAKEIGSIVLVGPQQSPPADLQALANVHLLPAVRTDTLAAMAHSAACLVMPYRDIEVTRAMQPLKLKEYLATGRPVVARQLPATLPWADCSDLVADATSFAKATLLRYSSGTPVDHLEGRRRLCEESWSRKAEEFWSYISI